jgi:hypothetical protein
MSHPAKSSSKEVGVPITRETLSEHDRRQNLLAADREQVARLQEERSSRMRAAAESLGLDIPSTLLHKMTQTYDEYGWVVHTE